MESASADDCLKPYGLPGISVLPLFGNLVRSSTTRRMNSSKGRSRRTRCKASTLIEWPAGLVGMPLPSDDSSGAVKKSTRTKRPAATGVRPRTNVGSSIPSNRVPRQVQVMILCPLLRRCRRAREPRQHDQPPTPSTRRTGSSPSSVSSLAHPLSEAPKHISRQMSLETAGSS